MSAAFSTSPRTQTCRSALALDRASMSLDWISAITKGERFASSRRSTPTIFVGLHAIRLAHGIDPRSHVRWARLSPTRVTGSAEGPSRSSSVAGFGFDSDQQSDPERRCAAVRRSDGCVLIGMVRGIGSMSTNPISMWFEPDCCSDESEPVGCGMRNVRLVGSRSGKAEFVAVPTSPRRPGSRSVGHAPVSVGPTSAI